MTTRMKAAQLVGTLGNRKRKRVNREGPLHKAILAHLRAVMPAGAVIHHSPNSIGLSGDRIMRQIVSDRSMGTVKGFPDLMCLLPGPRVWMFEVKAAGNYPDSDQRALHDALRDLGCMVAVVRSIEDVDEAIKMWGGVGQVDYQRDRG